MTPSAKNISVKATAWALAFYATGIAGFALLEVFSRAFYALADTWTVVRVGIAAMIANIALSLIFIQVIGVPGSLARGPFAGLALANALTTLLEALALWWLLRARVGDVNDAYVLAGASRALLAALGMGAALLGVLALLHDSGALAQLIAAGVIGGAVFFGLSLALGLPEARVVPMMALRRLKR
jgi:putative peptidoglycan lipid II flippase